MKRIEAYARSIKRPDLAALLHSAGRAALAAGAILRHRYAKPLHIRHKGHIDLVTEADLAAEQEILTILTRDHPGVAVMAEESSNQYDAAPAALTWVIDPLDGTTNFAHSFPWFGVSIACRDASGSLVGVIYCPMQDELFVACAGHGARLNNETIRVSAVSSLAQALLATGFPYDVHQHPEPVMAMLKAVITRVQGVRRPGAAALDLAYVACGRLDGFWEIGLRPWDTAAGQLLVAEAGGVLTDLQGGPFSDFVPELLCSNGLLHDKLVTILSAFRRS